MSFLELLSNPGSLRGKKNIMAGQLTSQSSWISTIQVQSFALKSDERYFSEQEEFYFHLTVLDQY
jgi:hypothetical protein